MKGNALVNGLIAVMIGSILAFAVVGPIMGNATLGTEYLEETVTNATPYTTFVNFTTDCAPLRSDTTYVTLLNSTGDDVSADVTLADATNGVYDYTDTITATDEITGTLTYRCLDSNYISNNIGRTIANIILPLVLVILVVGLTAFII